MMRSSQKSGRGRGKNNNRNKSSNRDSHSPNRVYESAGPEGKVRGTPQQIIDKYQALARDYQLSGDRVMAENFLQHAEHYVRILVAAQEAQAERQAQQQAQQNNGGGQPSHEGQSGGHGQQNGGDQRAAGDGPDIASSDQPPSDALGAIDAAQDGEPDIVETPENAAKSAAPAKPRRPRAKPKEAADKEKTAEPVAAPEAE